MAVKTILISMDLTLDVQQAQKGLILFVHGKLILEDFEQHSQEFDILKKATIRQPWLSIHGTLDPAVSLKNAELLKQTNAQAELFKVEGADHVFGAKYPYLQQKCRMIYSRCVKRLFNF